MLLHSLDEVSRFVNRSTKSSRCRYDSGAVVSGKTSGRLGNSYVLRLQRQRPSDEQEVVGGVGLQSVVQVSGRSTDARQVIDTSLSRVPQRSRVTYTRLGVAESQRPTKTDRDALLDVEDVLVLEPSGARSALFALP